MTPEELRGARKRLGLTAAAFARLFDVNVRTLRSWERGEARAPTIPRPVATLVRLALKSAAARRELGIKSAPEGRKVIERAEAMDELIHRMRDIGDRVFLSLSIAGMPQIRPLGSFPCLAGCRRPKQAAGRQRPL